MKSAHMAHDTPHRIGPREGTLTYPQIFKAQTFLIQREVGELAQTSVGVTMETVDKDLEVEVRREGSEVTVVECGLELTASVIPTTLILPKHTEHFLDTGNGVFGPGQMA
jgi:hypothetical protein